MEIRGDIAMQILFEREHCCSAAYDGDKRIGIAEIEDEDGRWIITHTRVDSAYGGQGIARRLIEAVITEARSRGKKIAPLCSYAEKMMCGKEEYRDVLADAI